MVANLGECLTKSLGEFLGLRDTALTGILLQRLVEALVFNVLPSETNFLSLFSTWFPTRELEWHIFARLLITYYIVWPLVHTSYGPINGQWQVNMSEGTSPASLREVTLVALIQWPVFLSINPALSEIIAIKFPKLLTPTGLFSYHILDLMYCKPRCFLK